MSCFAGMALTFKSLSYSTPTGVILFYVFLFGTCLYGTLNVVKGNSIAIPVTTLLLTILAAGLAFGGNMFDVEALKNAPNAGYATAVKSGQILIVVFGSLMLFKNQQLTASGLFGIFLILSGLVLLSLQKSS